MNLLSLIPINGLFVEIHYENVFDTKSGICFEKRSPQEFVISKNKLKGGMIGNTLLTPINDFAKLFNGRTDIRIGDLIFSNAQILVKHEGKKYILKKSPNYLRLCGKFVK